MTKKLNWSLILTLKELTEYLANYELNDICLNKAIRAKLIPHIFNTLELTNYDFKSNEVKYEEVNIYPSEILNNQLIQLNQEFSSFHPYINGLSISNEFNHVTLLNYSSKFPFLIKLNLSGIRLPAETCNQIFKNLPHLEVLNWVYSCIVQWRNTKVEEILLPSKLRAIHILNLTVKEILFIKNPLLVNDPKFKLYANNNEFYTFKGQNLPRLKFLSLYDQHEEIVININNFLSNNFDSIEYLQINVFNFTPNIFPAINNCPNLKTLKLYYYGLESSTVRQSSFPKFNFITRLQYDSCYNDHFEFNKSLMLSFPNLIVLESFYLSELENELVEVISSLKFLIHLKLINRRSTTINFNTNFNSNTLTELTLENFDILKFTPIIIEGCPLLTKINLVDYGADPSNIKEVENYYDKFPNWKTMVYTNVVRLYNRSKY